MLKRYNQQMGGYQVGRDVHLKGCSRFNQHILLQIIMIVYVALTWSETCP